jgi:hypothetical protein
MRWRSLVSVRPRRHQNVTDLEFGFGTTQNRAEAERCQRLTCLLNESYEVAGTVRQLPLFTQQNGLPLRLKAQETE